MRNFLTIFRRELSGYFNSAIAYIFLIVFVIFANGFFMMTFFPAGKVDMRQFFNSLPIILNIFIPAISMRLWAEDKSGYTFELLLTFPMKPRDLVLGKYLASVVFYAVALVSTFTIPLMMIWVGKPDLGPVIGGYLGALLMGGLFLAIGIFISGLCKDQIVAFVLTVIAAFSIFFIGSEFFAQFADGWVPGLGSFLQNHLGMLGHLTGFGKGVVDMRDVLYFALMIAVFLFLNGLSLEGRYRPKAKWVFSASVAVSLVSVVLIHWLAQDVPMTRWDLTEGKAYTVSGASKKILRNLKVPAQVKLYISPKEAMPTTLKTLEQDVFDKLEELRIVSDGKLKFKVIHVEAGPEGDETLKKSLSEEGIMPFQVESIQKDEMGIKLIYSALVIEYKERPSEIIPRIIPQTIENLEYQLLGRLYKMTFDEKPLVAMFVPAEEGKEEKDDFKTATLLIRNNGYEARRVALKEGETLPKELRLLLVLNPGVLSDRQRYEINRYLVGGGTVFVAAQAFEYSFNRREQGVSAMPKKLDLSINRLLEKWGVKIGEDVLLDQNSQVINLTTGQTIGPFAVQMPVKFLNQIIVGGSSMNPNASLTNRIASFAYLWGSALELNDGLLKKSNFKTTVLFSSSPESWKIQNDGSTELLVEQTKMPSEGIKGKYPLGVLLEGQFNDAFEGSVPAWKEGDAAETKAIDSPKPGRLVVVGCSKAFGEDLIQNPGNLSLFANLIDGYVLGEDLIEIRSKYAVARDIKRLSTGEKVWYRFWTVLLVPLLTAAFAGIRFFLRRKEKEFYLSAIRERGPANEV